MLISVVIPAFDEEGCLRETLTHLNRARLLLQQELHLEAEVIVVDNGSNDLTASVARTFNAYVASENDHNIAKVRNTGARISSGDILVFLDADTTVPQKLLSRVVQEMSDFTCIGGALDTDYRPKKRMVKLYLQVWRIMGTLTGMGQGATQFCRKDAFFALNGYDETLFMGEDVDFHWRLKHFAKSQNNRVATIEDVRVVPSTRRFDQWPLWRTLIWTNPLFIWIFRRRPRCWAGWYMSAPR